MSETQLKKYAELLVRAGGNVQKGQLVVVGCDVANAPFGRLVQTCAYDAGASQVVMDWSDEFTLRTFFLRAADDVFDTFPQWRIDKFKHQDDKGAVYLRIISDNPDLLAGVDPNRLRRFSRASSLATKAHSKLLMSNALRWSICAVPSPDWALKMFPDLQETEAISRLWQLIAKGARADGESPVDDWEKHRANFTERVNYLNAQQFDALRFTTGLGTDLTIGLVKNHVWAGGGDVAQDGIPFFPNLPTEEIFTMPDRGRAEGRVVASMPLSYQGNLIDGFEMTFKEGRVTAYKADKCQEVLANIIEMDEGAGRLGEVALVENASPINQMNTLFYNTLYDENASSHLAVGKSYPDNMQGGSALSTEELLAKGGNDSLIHVDFMFGTADMCVTGIYADGSEVMFFENGAFVKEKLNKSKL